MTFATSLRRALLFAAISLVVASPALAQGGIDLSWSDCGNFGQAIQSFACDSNVGQQVLIASAVPSLDLPQLNGMEAVIFVTPSIGSPTLSDWWQFASGGCRQIALSTSFDFTAGPSNCSDPWNGLAQGGMLYESTYGGPNRARLRVVCAIAAPTAVTANQEIEVFKVVITNAQTTGAGACAGCSRLACIVLSSILLTEPVGVGDVNLSNTYTRPFAIWQPSAGGTCFGDAVRTTTWGSVKSLYR